MPMSESTFSDVAAQSCSGSLFYRLSVCVCVCVCPSVYPASTRLNNVVLMSRWRRNNVARFVETPSYFATLC